MKETDVLGNKWTAVNPVAARCFGCSLVDFWKDKFYTDVAFAEQEGIIIT